MSRAASYQVVSCLGKGGFGEVYLTIARREGGLERKRALKLLRADLDRLDDAVARLRDEGRLLALLEHPAIVQVEDIVRIQGRVGLVMEYVEGTDLRQILRARLAFPPPVVLEIVATVADALASAVDSPSPTTGRPLRLVHRDIKPANIMVSRHGRVKLLDFGVARSREVSRDTQTRTGEVPMTPGFGAPEVLLHLVQEPPGDVFALGAVFFQILVGEALFRDVKLAQQASLFVSPRGYHDWLAERLEKIPDRAMRELAGEMLSWNAAERPPAQVVRERAERMLATAGGDNLARWVRGVDLPSPPAVADAELVGQTVWEEDGPGELNRQISTSPLAPRRRGPAGGGSPVPTPVSASPAARLGPPVGGLGAAHAVILEPETPSRAGSVRIGSTLASEDTLAGDSDTLRPGSISPAEATAPAPGRRGWGLAWVAALAVVALGLGAVVLAVGGLLVWAFAAG